LQNRPETPDCPLKKTGDAGVCGAAGPAWRGGGTAKTALFSEQDSVRILVESALAGRRGPCRRRVLLCIQYS